MENVKTMQNLCPNSNCKYIINAGSNKKVCAMAGCLIPKNDTAYFYLPKRNKILIIKINAEKYNKNETLATLTKIHKTKIVQITVDEYNQLSTEQ